MARSTNDPNRVQEQRAQHDLMSRLQTIVFVDWQHEEFTNKAQRILREEEQ